MSTSLPGRIWPFPKVAVSLGSNVPWFHDVATYAIIMGYNICRCRHQMIDSDAVFYRFRRQAAVDNFVSTARFTPSKRHAPVRHFWLPISPAHLGRAEPPNICAAARISHQCIRRVSAFAWLTHLVVARTQERIIFAVDADTVEDTRKSGATS